MYNKEQKILRFSMMLLFLALMIVYIVWYQVQGNTFKKLIQKTDSGSTIQILTRSGDIVPTISASLPPTTDDTGTVNLTGNNATITTGNVITNTGKTIANVTGTSIRTGTITNDATIRLLSGTSIYYGPIEVIEKLGIKYQYALTDETGIWYIYLGTPSYDFGSIARALKGNLYTVATEQDIIQNKLFGNKVVYINLPEYKDKQVLMLVYLNDGIWLIQIDYALYHKSKAYLKSLFTD